MPPLDEGTLLYMPTAPPGISADRGRARAPAHGPRAHAPCPEVARVFGKIGRADTATDMAPLSMIETVITLRPRAEWRPGMTLGRARRASSTSACAGPGLPNLFWMPIQTRTEMLSTGVRSELGVQVLGDDLAAIERTAVAIERALARAARHAQRGRRAHRTAASTSTSRSTATAAARLGLRARDVNEVVEAAIGGDARRRRRSRAATRYPIQVRYARDFREDPEALGRVLVATPGRRPVPLAQVASIGFRDGPAVRAERGGPARRLRVRRRRTTSAPVVDYVRDAQARGRRARCRCRRACGSTWTGQFQHFERARERLAWLVPLDARCSSRSSSTRTRARRSRRRSCSSRCRSR